MATAIINLEKSIKFDKYLQLMSRAEENSLKGKPKFVLFAAAMQNRDAAKIARDLNEPTLQSIAANKSYNRLMSTEPEEGGFIYKTAFTGGGSIPIYKIYEAAALVAEENNLGDEKRLSAARKAVATLIDDIKVNQPQARSHYGRHISCDAVEDLSEAQRIAKRFELTEQLEELEKVKNNWIKTAQQQLESLIRIDYQNPI